MSDTLHHECGLALIRLRKPLSHYETRYGTAFYGLEKMYLLMEKQHNRGQDGAGIATVKIGVKPGTQYIDRERSIENRAIQDLFKKVYSRVDKIKLAHKGQLPNVETLKEEMPFYGELLLGHLRYGTHGANALESCHPFLRLNNWMSRNLVMAGNFNLTNTDELIEHLLELGQHPRQRADTVTVMEKVGHFLDEENQRLFEHFKAEGFSNAEISEKIQTAMDVPRVIHRASRSFDGGYVMAGLIGHGDAFVLRDPNGIRPGFFYADEEVVAVASERPALQTAFGLETHDIQEIKPGHALIIRKDGSYSQEQILEPAATPTPCSFERIYFSRGSDQDIYKERKKLGELLVPQIVEAIEGDFENTVFAYIPNTAESAFLGVVKGLEDYLDAYKRDIILSAGPKGLGEEGLTRLLALRPRVEKAALKDVKLRTFITEDEARKDLVSHVYDITYGCVKPTDTLVVIDDSIVRGTTLKESILRMLDRLGPKKIIVLSSAPQIRYPDCYGIDMSRMGEFLAFKALVSLLEKRGEMDLLDDSVEKALIELEKAPQDQRNVAIDLYDRFTPEEIAAECALHVLPAGCKAEVELIFQTVEHMRAALPNNHGDWYFSGIYPTPGGTRVANRALVNYGQGVLVRAY